MAWIYPCIEDTWTASELRTCPNSFLFSRLHEILVVLLSLVNRASLVYSVKQKTMDRLSEIYASRESLISCYTEHRPHQDGHDSSERWQNWMVFDRSQLVSITLAFQRTSFGSSAVVCHQRGCRNRCHFLDH